MPDVLNTEIYDEVIPVSDEDAFDLGKSMAVEEGILVGISSGAALWAAIQVAKRPENHGKILSFSCRTTETDTCQPQCFSKISKKSHMYGKNPSYGIFARWTCLAGSVTMENITNRRRIFRWKKNCY